MNLKCETCGQNFDRKPSSANKTVHHFCSRKCWNYNADIHVVNRDYFEKIDSEEKAYWLGFIYADGSIHSKMNRLQVALSNKDKAHLSKFASIFESKLVEKKQISVCYIYGRKICEDLKSKGVVPRKTFIDSVEIYNCVPDDLLHHFVRGYFDGDGTVGVAKNTSFCGFVGLENFLNKMNIIIADNCGVSLNKIHKDGTIFSIRWNGNNQLLNIREWLYKNASICLERKKRAFFSLQRKKHKGSSSFRGVSWIENRKKWQSMIRYKNNVKFIGYFDSEIEAAKSYDYQALIWGMPKYKMNFV